MDDFSLYVLDITMNSVRAGATEIEISLTEDENGMLTFTVTDNGCGMSREQVEKLSDPFFTTRKTRSVGLGVPFLKMLAVQTPKFFNLLCCYNILSFIFYSLQNRIFIKNFRPISVYLTCIIHNFLLILQRPVPSFQHLN